MTGSSRKFSPILTAIWESGSVELPTGGHKKVAANINRESSDALYDMVLQERPKQVVEIGMAYGISTLTILSALAENGSGSLISIDPYLDWPTGKEVALNNVDKAGFSDLHMHIQEPSQIALGRMWQESRSFDLIYIDGYHNFEYF